MPGSCHEALHWEPERNERVHCTLCPHDCRIPDAAKGACGVRVNRHGTLYTLTYDRVVARHVDPIEKKPLFHFLPGTTAYSIGTGAGLRFVYEGNVPGSGGESTNCPACGQLLIERYGLAMLSNRIENGACPGCSERIEGIWSSDAL